MQSDNELLRQYARAGSEAAFAELVKRHVNLVYSTAFRQVGGDAHLAHDAAQNVFTDLARKADSLLKRESLTGWLYTSAYFAAGKIVRTEIRRREREEQLMRDPSYDTTADADWEKLRPILDAAMHGLKETDREAVLLRYFENRPYAEVGAKLGIAENTARMRVERALEKLRAQLSRKGITAGAALTSVISANAIQVTPPALAAALTNASLAAAGAGASFALFKLMTLTQLKIGLGALAVAGAVTMMALQHQTQQHLHNEIESLHRQITQLKTENMDTPVTNSNPMTSDELNELLRLRGEVGALRVQTNQLVKLQNENQKLQAAVAAAEKIKSADEVLTPDQEFSLLEMGTAKQAALGMILYANDHGNQLPTNLDQTAGYFSNSDTPFTNRSRFEITCAGSLDNLANPSISIIVREIQPWPHNGVWMRAYAYANGHGQMVSSPTTNFDDYEQGRAPLLKNQ